MKHSAPSHVLDTMYDDYFPHVLTGWSNSSNISTKHDTVGWAIRYWIKMSGPFDYLTTSQTLLIICLSIKTKLQINHVIMVMEVWIHVHLV